MKDAKEWVDEYSQSGALDMIDGCLEAAQIIREIQQDVIDGGKYKNAARLDLLLGNGAVTLRDLHRRNGFDVDELRRMARQNPYKYIIKTINSGVAGRPKVVMMIADKMQ